MISSNVGAVLERIAPSDRVLDIGGWAMPFNRANYVLDLGTYETRGIFGFQGPQQEVFSKATWIVQDICEKTPYPFPDKYFDYVICSHTLEDIRDPIWVCSEINRIGKRGYIEVPSAESEISFGVENKRYAGRYHHRWIIDILENEVVFTQKHHRIYSSWKYHLPSRFFRNLSPQKHVQYLFWENHFSFRENVLLSSEAVDSFYTDKVALLKPYSDTRYILDALQTQLKQFFRKIYS